MAVPCPLDRLHRILDRDGARGGKAVAERETAYSRLSHYLPLAIAVCLLAAPDVPFAPLNPLRALDLRRDRLRHWARLWIAGNWSSDVTLKRDHELVTTGPYRWVRHPIYTGVLLALLGSALAVGEWRGLLAVILAGAAFWRKLGIEEAVMRRQFGAAYASYAEHVPALIPFVL